MVQENAIRARAFVGNAFLFACGNAEWSARPLTIGVSLVAASLWLSEGVNVAQTAQSLRAQRLKQSRGAAPPVSVPSTAERALCL
jgi:hypothetical protein